MRTACPASGPAVAAFTLIEMIGVLAILTILAGVVTPNILHSIERAEVRAEADTLHALGGQIALYLRDNAAPPTSAVPPALPNWTTQLSFYASLNAADILTNKRQMTRLYVPDPIAINQRSMLISSMRTGLALPAAATISANFQAVWNTVDGTVPAAPGWGAWTAGPGGNIEYLVIERINLASVYRNELLAWSVTLNNASGSAASYQIISATGGPGAIVPVANLTHPTLTPLYSRDRLNLFNKLGVLNYTYVISNSGKTFTFDGTNWNIP